MLISFNDMLTSFKDTLTNFTELFYICIIVYLDDNNIQYTIHNRFLYSVLTIPQNNIKIYNYYISNYYMFYKNDKYLGKIHGVCFYSPNFRFDKILVL